VCFLVVAYATGLTTRADGAPLPHALDIRRHKELVVKAVSSVLLMLLRLFRANRAFRVGSHWLFRLA
jgi:hypothetical protein